MNKAIMESPPSKRKKERKKDRTRKKAKRVRKKGKKKPGQGKKKKKSTGTPPLDVLNEMGQDGRRYSLA